MAIVEVTVHETDSSKPQTIQVKGQNVERDLITAISITIQKYMNANLKLIRNEQGELEVVHELKQ